jgi:adenylyltransferase/sulfurtransferase
MIMIGDAQRKLRRANALVVGAGALGCEVSKNLALLGFGKITIIDFDKVEFSNLSRCFFTKTDIGRKKAIALVKKLKTLFPYVKLKPICKKVEECKRYELSADVIISALDNMVARLWLSKFAYKNHIPIVDGGIRELVGRVQVVLPDRQTPCLACSIPKSKYAEITGLKNPCEDIDEDDVIASFLPVASLVAGIQANEAMKIILDMDVLSGVLIMDLKSNNYSVMKLKRNKNCFVCASENIQPDVNVIFEEVIPDCVNSNASTKYKKRW